MDHPIQAMRRKGLAFHTTLNNAMQWCTQVTGQQVQGITLREPASGGQLGILLDPEEIDDLDLLRREP